MSDVWKYIKYLIGRLRCRAIYRPERIGPDSLNLLGRLGYRQARSQRKTPLPLSSNLAQDVFAQLRRDGIATFDLRRLTGGTRIYTDLLDHAWGSMERHQSTIDDAKSNCNALGGENDGSKKTYMISWNVERDFATVPWQIAVHPEVLAVVNSYMGMYAEIDVLKYWLNFAIPNQEATRSQLWHRDPGETVLKLFVYLNDVDQGAGPFTYAKGTHAGSMRKLKAPMRGLTDESLKQWVPSHHWVAMTGTRGTCVLANTAGYHKGGKAVESDRHLLFCHYALPLVPKSPSFTHPEPPSNVHRESLHPAQVAALPS